MPRDRKRDGVSLSSAEVFGRETAFEDEKNKEQRDVEKETKQALAVLKQEFELQQLKVQTEGERFEEEKEQATLDAAEILKEQTAQEAATKQAKKEAGEKQGHGAG